MKSNKDAEATDQATEVMEFSLNKLECLGLMRIKQ